MVDIAVELGTAYISLVPSAKGIIGNITKELAPIEGAAAATGSRAGSKMGGTLTSQLKQSLSAFPTASLGPIGGLLGAGLVAGFGAALIGIAQEFASARNQIIKETGQTGKALEGTFASVKNVFADVPSSLHDVTTAVDLLRQRGVPLGAQLDQLAKQELELAHITGTDLATNVEATTALFAKFGVTLRDQPAVLDALFKASQQSGKGLADMLDNLKTGATVLGQFGFDIKQSAALIATLEKAGVNATPALAALKKAFGDITKAGGDPKKALQSLIDEFSNGTAPAQAMADAMKLFGNRAGAELATAIQKGKFNVKDLLKIITDGKGGILQTAEATRTLGERFAIMRHQAELALLPIASAVWNQLKGVLLDLQAPLGNLVTGFVRFATAAAPIVAILGVALIGALHSIAPLVDTFAVGLDTIASVLEHIPPPVLVVAGAIAALAIAFSQISNVANAAQTALAAWVSSLSTTQTVLVVIGAAILAIGAAVKLFGSQTTAASIEGKALADSLFATGTAGAFFKDNITSAAQGLIAFLVAQDQAGKNTGLKDALVGTGLTLREVGNAVAGTAQDFERLKSSAIDTSGFNKQQQALLASGKAANFLGLNVHGLNEEQVQAVVRAQDQAKALDQQRDAFVRSAQAQLEAASRAGDLTKAQLASAEAIAHNTTGVRGYGAALDFANTAIAEHAKKQQAVADAAVKAAGGEKSLTQAVLSGKVGTDDATTAVGKYGLSLDKTKSVIKDTQEALKKFTDEGLAGFGDTSSIINDWASGIDKAFQEVADSSGKSSKDVRKAQNDLKAATDPGVVIRNLQAQATQIATFTGNILKIVQRFPAAARALISDPNKGAAAAMAQAIINNPTIGKQFDSAQVTVQTKTAQLKALLEGPLAQQLLGGGKAMGQATTKGYSDAVTFVRPTQVQVLRAAQVINANKKPVAAAAAGMARGAGTQYLQNFDLRGPTFSQASHAKLVLEAAKKPHGAAAKALAADAQAKYGGNLKLPERTASSVAGAAGAFTGGEAQTVALRASIQGGRIGVAFGEGIAAGMGQSGVLSDIAGSAARAASVAENAAKKALGISSPSRIAFEIGENFGQSLASGLSKTEGLVGTAGTHMADHLVAQFGGVSSARGLATSATLARSVPASAVQPVAISRGRQPIVNIEKLYARDDEDVARVIAAQQRRQYLLSTL